MLAIYLGALVVGLVVIGVQAFVGHDVDAAGHDLATADHDAPPWALFASLRFWSFGLLAFGLAGALITALGLAGAVVAAVVAGVAGIASGALAVTVVSRMTLRGPSSQIAREEVVGRIGRVIVPSDAGARGKVRVEIRGGTADYVAVSREALAEGDAIVVEEYDGREALVSKAPKELEP